MTGPRFGALMRALELFGQQTTFRAADLGHAIEAERPDVIVLDPP